MMATDLINNNLTMMLLRKLGKPAVDWNMFLQGFVFHLKIILVAILNRVICLTYQGFWFSNWFAVYIYCEEMIS